MWWWNPEVQNAVKEKRIAYKRWQRSLRQEDKRMYSERKREMKIKVSEAKAAAWQQWSQDLTTSEGRLNMFKMARQMKKERKDVIGVRFIKGEDGPIKTEKQDILRRWQQYFEVLLNEENEWNIDYGNVVEGPVEEIKAEEVKKALKKMKNGKAAGPTQVTADLLKAGGDFCGEELAGICRRVAEVEKPPDDWKDSWTSPIYKGKGDARLCEKHRGIRLLEHAMKVYEKVLDGRLREILQIDSRQFWVHEWKVDNRCYFYIEAAAGKIQRKEKEIVPCIC